jgi:IclR family KDG regulon transcriptional repressor
MQEYKTIKDLAKVLSLFNNFQTEELSVAEISKALGMSPSKVSRMLGTLERVDIIEREPKYGKYHLGIMLFELGVAYAYHFPLRKIIRPHIEQMAKEIQVTVSWGVLKKNRVIILDRIQNTPIDVLTYRVGLNMPVHSTAVGKVLLAHLPEDQQDSILRNIDLKRLTDATKTEPEQIKQDLRMIKEKGYATDEEETYEGGNGIAVPIRDGSGQVTCAISLADEKSKTSREQLFNHKDYLKEKALFISRQLGFRTF